MVGQEKIYLKRLAVAAGVWTILLAMVLTMMVATMMVNGNGDDDDSGVVRLHVVAWTVAMPSSKVVECCERQQRRRRPAAFAVVPSSMQPNSSSWWRWMAAMRLLWNNPLAMRVRTDDAGCTGGGDEMMLEGQGQYVSISTEKGESK